MHAVRDIYCLEDMYQSIYGILAEANLKLPVKMIEFLQLLHILTCPQFSRYSKPEPNAMPEQMLQELCDFYQGHISRPHYYSGASVCDISLTVFLVRAEIWNVFSHSEQSVKV